MEFKDFTITTSINDTSKQVTDVQHKEFDAMFWLVDDAEKLDISDKANNFIGGVTNSFRVWSDYDCEEASTDVYIAMNKNDGSIVQYTLTNMEALFEYLNDDKYDVYHVRIEDGLL